MTVFDAIILGIVEGVTEYLPVSSTGHLILAASVLGLGNDAGGANMASIKESLNQFEIIIQGGAILAVAGLYWKRLRTMAQGCVGTALPQLATRESRIGFGLLVKLVIAFIPAAVVGLAFRKTIKAHLFFPGPVVAALLVGGVAMVLLKGWNQKKIEQYHEPGDALARLTLKGALLIGLMQVLALMPGTSRSLVTLLGGMLVGLPPVAAAEFAFLPGLPTLGAASLKESWDVFHGDSTTFQQFVANLGGPLPIIVGLVTATISAAISVKWLVKWLGNHTLSIFGWWRIVVAGSFAWAVYAGWIARS